MTVLFDDVIRVHYGFIFLNGADGPDDPDLSDARTGQRNGLCGAVIPEVLSLVTGLHTGRVPFTLEWHESEPPLTADWEEVVEVPFEPVETSQVLSAFQDYHDVQIPRAVPLRARYCAYGMDAANIADTVQEGDPAPDRYLLALWPSAPSPDTILRQTSDIAAYWHSEAQSA